VNDVVCRVLLIVEDWHRVNILVSHMWDYSSHDHWISMLLDRLHLDNRYRHRHRLLDGLLHHRSRLYLDDGCNVLGLADFNENSSLAFCPVSKVKVVDMKNVFKDSSSNMIS
jgi:hypothetical protein